MSVAPVTAWLRLTLLGVGAMNSPRYPPAGLLVRYRRRQVMLDGGPGAEPTGKLLAWLVSDVCSAPPVGCSPVSAPSPSPIS
jgi:hypothetical protein